MIIIFHFVFGLWKKKKKKFSLPNMISYNIHM